jgi:hypothetical protein
MIVTIVRSVCEGRRGDIMLGLVDRLLARVAPKVTVEAACSRSYVCRNGTKYLIVCCKDEGCQSPIRVGTC